MDELLQASLPDNKFDVIEDLMIVVMDGSTQLTVPFPHDAIPLIVAECANAVAKHTVSTKSLPSPHQIAQLNLPSC
jgi:hypothetical protein